MARQDFLAGLGAALLNVSDSGRANRAEDFQRQQAKQREEMERMRMALSREQFGLDQEQFGLQKDQFEATQQRDARSFAKDVLETAGPNGMLNDVDSLAVEKGGFSSRLSPRQEGTLDSKPFVMDTINTTLDAAPGIMQQASPGLAPGRQVMPTSDQQFQIDTQNKARNIEETRKRAQSAVSQPGYYKMPEMNRAVVWQQAGFDGNPPMSMDEWKSRQDYTHGQDMQRVGAQIAGMNQRDNPIVVNRGGKAVPLRSLAEWQDGDTPWSNQMAGVGKPPTAVQLKAISTYNKLQQADAIMREIENDPNALSPQDLAIINNTPDWTPQLLKNAGLSENGQRYAQAGMAWGEGRLRDDSGAAINSGEYTTDRLLSTLQKGDLPKTKTQKRNHRKGILRSFGLRSGPAYKEFTGRDFVPEPDDVEDGAVALPAGVRILARRPPGGGQ